MKFTAFALLSMGLVANLSSCNKEDEHDGTAVEALCGQWMVYVKTFPNSVDSVKAHRNFLLWTSNTSENVANKLLVTDYNSTSTAYGFRPRATNNYDFDFTVNADCDVSALSFSCTDADNKWWRSVTVSGVAQYREHENTISIRNGKITKDAVTLPSGTKADKIELEITYSNLTTIVWYPAAADGFYIRLVGYRVSGFNEDASFVYEGE
jgi:hypothetical protein